MANCGLSRSYIRAGPVVRHLAILLLQGRQIGYSILDQARAGQRLVSFDRCMRLGYKIGHQINVCQTR